MKEFIEECVIAPLTATMPVVLFTLSLKEITKNYSIPTYVWFKRKDVWNYSKMPNNVQIPSFCYDENLNIYEDEKFIFKKFAKLVKELYTSNPNIKFHFYFNDMDLLAYTNIVLANNLPKENFDVTFLTDGCASAVSVGKYNSNQYKEILKEVKNEYKEFKKTLKLTSKLKNNPFTFVKNETNIKWCLTTDISKEQQNKQLIKDLNNLNTNGKLVVKNISELFSALPTKEKKKIKLLLNAKSKILKSNKNNIIFLGTWNENEYNLEEFLKIVKQLYPNYNYFYKGHPKTPTNSINGKSELLKNLNFVDINSNIPAEIILLTNPKTLICGYNSTTFYSIDLNQRAILFANENNLDFKGFKYIVDINNNIYKNF